MTNEENRTKKANLPKLTAPQIQILNPVMQHGHWLLVSDEESGQIQILMITFLTQIIIVPCGASHCPRTGRFDNIVAEIAAVDGLKVQKCEVVNEEGLGGKHDHADNERYDLKGAG